MATYYDPFTLEEAMKEIRYLRKIAQDYKALKENQTNPKGTNMTLEVIGTDKNFLKNCSCPNCASIIAYAKADVQVKTIRDYTNSPVKQNFVSCPKCKKDVNLFTLGR